MEHVGMILFLSDVKALADGKIRVTSYKEPIGDCYTTNESAVRYEVQAERQPLEQLFVFASDMVRNRNITYQLPDKTRLEYRDEAGKTWTHLAYFIKRIEDVVPDAAGCTEVESYDEKAPVQSNMYAIVKMAKRIDAYVASLPEGDTLVLHADCTGGMRHAAMIMIAVLRLMQYDDRVRIGDILYSNYQKQVVEKANDIYGLFDLIAGAEEFVRFGSVQTMLDYYKKQDRTQQSPELQQLLQAMTAFAEAISLCHYGTFRKAIDALRTAMQAFHDRWQSGEDALLADALMNRLYGRIRHEYKALLQEGEPDDLTLIDWCVQHDYIQQALTLYTERVPEIFDACHLAKLTDSGKPVFKEQFTNDKTTSFAFKLYTLFRDKEAETQAQQQADSQHNSYCRLLKQEITAIRQQAKKDTNTDFAKLAVEKVTAHLDGISHSAVDGSVSLTDPDGLAEGFALIQALARTPGKVMQGELGKTMTAKCRQLQQFYLVGSDAAAFQAQKFYAHGKTLCNWSSQMKQQEALTFFSDFSIPYSERFIRLLRRGWVVSDVPEEKLRSLLDHYGALKDERNHTNHARKDQQSLNVADIKKLLRQGLEEISDICRMRHADVP